MIIFLVFHRSGVPSFFAWYILKKKSHKIFAKKFGTTFYVIDKIYRKRKTYPSTTHTIISQLYLFFFKILKKFVL